MNLTWFHLQMSNNFLSWTWIKLWNLTIHCSQKYKFSMHYCTVYSNCNYIHSVIFSAFGWFRISDSVFSSWLNNRQYVLRERDLYSNRNVSLVLGSWDVSLLYALLWICFTLSKPICWFVICYQGWTFAKTVRGFPKEERLNHVRNGW